MVANTYDFGFTALSLRVKELVKVAGAHQKDDDTDIIQEIARGKTSSGKRFLIEIKKRLESLTEAEKDILIHGDLYAQRQIAFLSMCKVYGFIRDFILEVCREKVLVFDYYLTEGEYVSFLRRKLESNSRMNDYTELTLKKIRQVLFKTLEEAGIINNIKEKQIQPQILDSKVIQAIHKDDKEWLKLFFLSDMDIERID